MRKTTLINIFLLVFLLLITARFVVAGWNRILFNSNSAEGDQAVYLQLGLDFREDGTLTDGKRHPLYPIFLSTFAERAWWYFTWAKILNLGIGVITIWAVFLIGRTLFNPITGLVAAFLLGINMEFIFHSTFALTESLLILLFLLAWFTMTRALQRPEQVKYWLAAGGLTGLAYLAKGTGPLIGICFFITATLIYRLRLWRLRAWWGFVASFCLVSLPLWLFNWLTYGSPLFNATITNYVWMDSATDKYVADPSALPTLTTFLQEKSPEEIWSRLWTGLELMRYYYVRVLWPTRTLLLDEWFQAGHIDLILVLLVMVLLVSWRLVWPAIKRHRHMLLLSAVTVAVFYVLFGWYTAVTPYPVRFLITLVPFLYLLLSAGGVGLADRLFAAPQLPNWAKFAGGAFIFGLALWLLAWSAVTGWLIARDSLRNPFVADAEFNEYIDQALRWTQTGHPVDRSVAVMWGPTHMLPIWKHSHQLNLLRTPVSAGDTVQKLTTFMAANKVAYVIVDRQMVDRIGQDRAAAWGIHPVGGSRLEIEDYPANWAFGFAGPEMPCQWCVFRRLEAPPPIEPVQYELGQAIQLFGYELLAADFYPGGQVEVTLYWASQQPVTTDYTVFTQLLGPDFQLHGQMDRQPLSGHWPTSRWQPGQKFVDKFVLEVDEAAPPGQYLLLVGLYDVNTGQRLPVTLDGLRLPDDAIRLVRLTMPNQSAAVTGEGN